MAKKKGSFGFDVDGDGDDDVTIETTASTSSIEVPEGHDDAIYRQGYAAGQAFLAAGPDAVAPENAFAAGTPQAESWQAGYDAGSVPPV